MTMDFENMSEEDRGYWWKMAQEKYADQPKNLEGFWNKLYPDSVRTVDDNAFDNMKKITVDPNIMDDSKYKGPGKVDGPDPLDPSGVKKSTSGMIYDPETQTFYQKYEDKYYSVQPGKKNPALNKSVAIARLGEMFDTDDTLDVKLMPPHIKEQFKIE